MPRLLPLLATASLLLLTMPHPAIAQPLTPAGNTPSASSEKIVNIDTFNADLHTVISLLEREAGVRVRIQDGSEAYKPVTVHLNDTPLPRALRDIALSAGADVVSSHGGYVLRPFGVPTPPTLAVAPVYRWHSLILQHAVPSEILRQMRWNSPGPVPNPLPNQTASDPSLPEGVRRVFALRGNNSLLFEATDESFARVKQIVGPLDVVPRQVEIKVEFVPASIADVDNLGINFDLIPLPDPPTQADTPAGDTRHSFLQFATGKIVSQLYQTLTRTRGRAVSAPLVTTLAGVAATVSVDARVPDPQPDTTAKSAPLGPPQFPQIAHPLYVQGTLTLTPYVYPDGTIGLEMLSPTGSKTVTLRAIHSGDPLVFIATVASSLPILGGLFRNRNKMPSGDELLVFVTPTIIGESDDHAPASANGGESVTVMP